VIFVYGCWKVLHAYLWRTPESMYAWQSKLSGYEEFYARLTAYIVRIFGYHATSTGNVIHLLDYSYNLSIAEHCLAIPAMVVFAFSILLFKGKMSDKLWFIPLGLIAIFFINLIRIVSVAMAGTYFSVEMHDFLHRTVYLIITYATILLMVVWWMNRTMKNLDRDNLASS
jgi:exosortase/archaeosortase family protein